MTTHRYVSLSRRAAARLLERPDLPGDATAPAVAGAGRVLAAAAAPAADGELAGEPAAVAMFRAASLAPATIPAPRRRAMLKPALAKLAAAKLLAMAAVATAATGGIALAAATGALPNPLGNGHAHVRVATTDVPTAGPSQDTDDELAATDDSSTSASDDGSTSASDESSTEASDASSTEASTSDTASAEASSSHAAPTPSLFGLCHAYQAGATSNRGHALQNPAFTALVTAAGGTENVGAYCTNLIGAPAAHPGGKQTSPSGGKPTSHPGGKPTSHPGGKPTSHPGGKQTSHPGGKPTSHSGGKPTSHRH